MVTLHNTLPKVFGPLGNYLPDFIHPFSFILITAGIISCRKREYIIICLSWLVIDYAFELGQKYDTLLLRIIPDWFSGFLFLEAAESYFRMGTFDCYDIIAIFLGTAMAYLFLIFIDLKK